MGLIEYTREFTDAKKATPVTQVGTLSISIPTRKKFIDRKGRKRRKAIKYELGLTSGQGAMTGKSLIKMLGRDMAGVNKSRPIDTKLYRKIMQVYK